MFKKLLFLLILAVIGFGIYTGISKITETLSTKKTEIVTVVTGSTTSNSTIVPKNTSDVGEVLDTSDSDSTEPSFFSRTWTTIKGWFSKEDTQEIEIVIDPIENTTGSILGGEILSGDSNLSGDILSGDTDFMSGYLSDDEIYIDTKNENTDSQSTGSKIELETKIETPTTTTTTKTTTTVKKTTTTKDSGKDPILDSLFN